MLVLSKVSALLSLCAWTTGAQAPIRVAAGADNDAAAPSEPFSWLDETGESLDLLLNGRRVTRYMYACDSSTTESRQATYKPYHHAFDAAGEGLDLRYRIWVAEGNIPEDEASRNALRRQMDARYESFASAPRAEAASTEGK